MSGRIRTIKPELLDDAVTANLSDMAFRLFMAAIVLADDYGRLRAEPGWLMGQVYWARTVQVETFLAAMSELEPLLRFYTVNGQRYAEIRNWAKHQKVSHPGKPRIPGPPEDLPRPSGESPETLVPDLRSPITDQGPPTTDHQAPPAEPSVPVDEPTGVRSRRGARLPDGWRPSEATQAWAREQGVAEPCGVILDEFRDFWRAVPGARGVKLDWDATFRNRVRDVAGRSSGRALRIDTRQPLRNPEQADWLKASGGDL